MITWKNLVRKSITPLKCLHLYHTFTQLDLTPPSEAKKFTFPPKKGDPNYVVI